MSKQSNQRFRKELEKCQNAYMESLKNSEQDNYNDCSHTNDSNSKDCSQNLVDSNKES